MLALLRTILINSWFPEELIEKWVLSQTFLSFNPFGYKMKRHQILKTPFFHSPFFWCFLKACLALKEKKKNTILMNTAIKRFSPWKLTPFEPLWCWPFPDLRSINLWCLCLPGKIPACKIIWLTLASPNPPQKLNLEIRAGYSFSINSLSDLIIVLVFICVK